MQPANQQTFSPSYFCGKTALWLNICRKSQKQNWWWCCPRWIIQDRQSFKQSNTASLSCVCKVELRVPWWDILWLHLCALTRILVKIYTSVVKMFIGFSANTREQITTAFSFLSMSVRTAVTVCAVNMKVTPNGARGPFCHLVLSLFACAVWLMRRHLAPFTSKPERQPDSPTFTFHILFSL